RLLDLGRGEIHPSHDAADELVGGGGVQELARLLDAGNCLDQDRLLDTVVGQQRPQVVGAEWPPDRGQLVAHPRVFAARGVPEVVVGVDDHASSNGHSSSGMSAWKARTFSSTSATDRHPVSTVATAGCRSGN